ncbi:hypothetical protein X975_10998, partial [Stegodyphus mimosarum]
MSLKSPKSLKKDELMLVAEELGLVIPSRAKIVTLKTLIESSEVYGSDAEFVQNVIDNILEEKKIQREKQKSENKIRLEIIKLSQLEAELALANTRNVLLQNQNVETDTSSRNMENLIKSVKILTISVPTKAESFNLFFQSIEWAFGTKQVPEDLKAEILLNIVIEKGVMQKSVEPEIVSVGKAHHPMIHFPKQNKVLSKIENGDAERNAILQCQDVTIPRYCFLDCVNQQAEVHVFCDASPSAYGTVVYFRYCENNVNDRVSFIMSKSRVSPLKKLMLPQLELMAMVIGARVGNYLKSVFKDKIGRIVFWSESCIALHWVKGSAKRWKQFVANRVVEIQDRSSPSDWYYCSSEDNPAHLLTRGISTEKLVLHEKWCSGPIWLRKSFESWPNQ